MGHNMGRRKIDIAYLQDDRVRKVTFCKRKGGLFKKAEDLSKLCGVEIAVVIVAEKKTCEFASTDMNRILTRYKEMQRGEMEDTSETARLWAQLEQQRRELEGLTRELAQRDTMLQQQQQQFAAVQQAAAMAFPPTSAPMGLPHIGGLPCKLPEELPAGSAPQQAPMQDIDADPPPTILSPSGTSGIKREREDDFSDDTAGVDSDELQDGTTQVKRAKSTREVHSPAHLRNFELEEPGKVAFQVQSFEAMAAANASPAPIPVVN